MSKRLLLAAVSVAAAWPLTGLAATIGPPMLDVSRQCDVASRHNVTAMSECIVAESEARSDLLQHWARLSDEAVERCVKVGRKAKRLPYTAMEKCLAPDLLGPATAQSPTVVNDTK